ncbi:MAG: penicillin acylase family protein, partial [Deltaproteobacteria bacterium]|nr:penicillin acylase family protein [Deltaproteobacteria bacterium]
TLDPSDSGKYMEGGASVPFRVIQETLRIKDSEASGGYREEKLEIKFTRRGPVVSGVLAGLKTQKVITLRWAAAETMSPKMGFHELLAARSASELRDSIRHLNFIVLNCVFADVDGNIGWHVSGKLPIRSQGDSTVPYVVRSGQDNWIGWIPFERMPHAMNPSRGWVGTCNHKTVLRDYPYYFSSYFATSYRYQRLVELLDRSTPASVSEHWQFQRDTKNLMAKEIAPVMAKALLAHEDTRKLGETLASWDHSDDPGQVPPSVFQAVYRNFAWLVFQDELGEDLTNIMLEEGYFWQERLQKMVMDRSSPWFDNVLTQDKKETMEELFHQAALEAIKQLNASLGSNIGKWQWGEAHQIEFVNPIRRTGFGKSLLGGGSHPMGGSRETLYCAWYDFAKPFDVILAASLRMVADLGDEDKVLAVLPGGVSGRTFDPHMKDQIQPFMRGDPVYWWF